MTSDRSRSWSLAPRVAAQLGEGAGDQLAHRMAAVERRIGILEDDLQRLLVGCRSLGGLARHRVAVEGHLAALIGCGQAHQNPRQRGLAAPGLTDQSHRLSGGDVEIHLVEPPDGLAAHVEGLARRAHLHHRLAGALAGFGRRRLLAGGAQRHRLGALVVVAAGAASPADLVHRRRLGAAALVGQAAAVGVDAALDDRARRGQRARDGGQGRPRPVGLAGELAAGDGAQQPDRVRVAGVLEHLLRRALLDQFAGVEHADPVAHLGDHREVVADEQQ